MNMINNFILKLLTIAAVPLLLTACGEKKGTDRSETVAIQNTPEDTNTKSDQNNADAFSDVKVFRDVANTTKKHIRNLLKHYHALKDAMVREESAKAKEIGQEMIKELDTFDSSALPETQQAFYNTHIRQIKEGSAGISATTDIHQQREGLPALTSSLYSLAKAYQANQETLYYQYCPMAFDFKGAAWISDTEEVENPYFGDEMLHCGATRTTLTGNQN